MSVAAIKRTTLSDGDKTSEYEVPAEFVVKKVQDLKTEQNKIETQIEAAKVQPVVRQQDENTQVFNLRQMQLVQKIKELEARMQLKVKLEFHHGAYWMRLEDGKFDGPFSTLEWDKSQRVVRLADHGPDDYDGVTKVYFYDVSNKENVFVPLSFLQEQGVRAYAK